MNDRRALDKNVAVIVQRLDDMAEHVNLRFTSLEKRIDDKCTNCPFALLTQERVSASWFHIKSIWAVIGSIWATLFAIVLLMIKRG
jgi:hypothetical protein